MSISSISDRAVRRSDDISRSAANTAASISQTWMDIMFDLQRSTIGSMFSVAGSAPSGTIQAPQRRAGGVEVIQVGEERLNVSPHTIKGETTRVRRRVVARPVERQVTLRDEKVVVERRAPTGASTAPVVLTETIVEMSDSRQVPTVWKSVHVTEEVVLRMEVRDRVENVVGTVRHDVIEVERDRNGAGTMTQNRDDSTPKQDRDDTGHRPVPRVEHRDTAIEARKAIEDTSQAMRDASGEAIRQGSEAVREMVPHPESDQPKALATEAGDRKAPSMATRKG